MTTTLKEYSNLYAYKIILEGYGCYVPYNDKSNYEDLLCKLIIRYGIKENINILSILIEVNSIKIYEEARKSLSRRFIPTEKDIKKLFNNTDSILLNQIIQEDLHICYNILFNLCFIHNKEKALVYLTLFNKNQKYIDIFLTKESNFYTNPLLLLKIFKYQSLNKFNINALVKYLAFTYNLITSFINIDTVDNINNHKIYDINKKNIKLDYSKQLCDMYIYFLQYISYDNVYLDIFISGLIKHVKVHDFNNIITNDNIRFILFCIDYIYNLNKQSYQIYNSIINEYINNNSNKKYIIENVFKLIISNINLTFIIKRKLVKDIIKHKLDNLLLILIQNLELKYFKIYKDKILKNDFPKTYNFIINNNIF